MEKKQVQTSHEFVLTLARCPRRSVMCYYGIYVKRGMKYYDIDGVKVNAPTRNSYYNQHTLRVQVRKGGQYVLPLRGARALFDVRQTDCNRVQSRDRKQGRGWYRPRLLITIVEGVAPPSRPGRRNGLNSECLERGKRGLVGQTKDDGQSAMPTAQLEAEVH